MRGALTTAITLLALLTLPPACECAKKKKRRRAGAAPTKVPLELESGCPFWRDEADAKELSEYGHELERDGRKAEALPCYVRAMRTSPSEPIGYLDLAVAKQYDDPSFAMKLYRQGVLLKPTYHDVHNQFGILLRTNGRQEEATRQFISASRLRPNDADAFFRELQRPSRPPLSGRGVGMLCWPRAFVLWQIWALRTTSSSGTPKRSTRSAKRSTTRTRTRRGS